MAATESRKQERGSAPRIVLYISGSYTHTFQRRKQPELRFSARMASGTPCLVLELN